MSAVRNIEIERLRAISIILVLIAHGWLASPLAAQFILPLVKYFSFGVGVDLFFCISGYVVGKSYVAYIDGAIHQKRFVLAAMLFWMKRAFRLLPSAWAWVAFGLFCSMFFNSSGVFFSLNENIISATYIAIFAANYSIVDGTIGPNSIYWSLSLEEQFYFMFPFFLLATSSSGRRIWLLIIIIAIQFPLSRNIFGGLDERYYSAFRIDGFCWGLLLSLVQNSPVIIKINESISSIKRIWLPFIVVFLILLLIAIPVWLHDKSYYMGFIAIIAAALVFLASCQQNIISVGSRLNLIMFWMGSRSYAIYLIHWPISKLVNEIAHRMIINYPNLDVAIVSFSQLALWIILTAFLSEINYRTLELPFRAKGSALANKLWAAKS